MDRSQEVIDDYFEAMMAAIDIVMGERDAEREVERDYREEVMLAAAQVYCSWLMLYATLRRGEPYNRRGF